MRQINFLKFVFVACMVFIFYGCFSVPDSPAPRFYTLQAIDEFQPTEKFKISSDQIIGVGPVKIPGYLNRPQMVTRDKNNMLNFAQFDRWGESLDHALGRLIREDLRILLTGATMELYPWGIDVPVKYQVFINVEQMASDLDKDLFFAAQWSVFDLEKKKMLLIKRSEFRQPIKPNNYSGLASTLSEVCASLSSQIAKEVSLLEGEQEKQH